MSSDVFYFIGFVFAILILFILPKTKEIFEKNGEYEYSIIMKEKNSKCSNYLLYFEN